MAQNKNLRTNSSKNKEILFLPKTFYIALTCIDLIFFSTFADPFNVPKLIALLIFGGWLAGYLLSGKNLNYLKIDKKFIIMISI